MSSEMTDLFPAEAMVSLFVHNRYFRVFFVDGIRCALSKIVVNDARKSVLLGVKSGVAAHI